jgi:hypothetical protein
MNSKSFHISLSGMFVRSLVDEAKRAVRHSRIATRTKFLSYIPWCKWFSALIYLNSRIPVVDQCRNENWMKLWFKQNMNRMFLKKNCLHLQFYDFLEKTLRCFLNDSDFYLKDISTSGRRRFVSQVLLEPKSQAVMYSYFKISSLQIKMNLGLEFRDLRGVKYSMNDHEEAKTRICKWSQL